MKLLLVYCMQLEGLWLHGECHHIGDQIHMPAAQRPQDWLCHSEISVCDCNKYVCPQLEHGLSVWDPHCDTNIKALETPHVGWALSWRRFSLLCYILVQIPINNTRKTYLKVVKNQTYGILPSRWIGVIPRQRLQTMIALKCTAKLKQTTSWELGRPSLVADVWREITSCFPEIVSTNQNRKEPSCRICDYPHEYFRRFSEEGKQERDERKTSLVVEQV